LAWSRTFKSFGIPRESGLDQRPRGNPRGKFAEKLQPEIFLPPVSVYAGHAVFLSPLQFRVLTDFASKNKNDREKTGKLFLCVESGTVSTGRCLPDP
jgi:hypothetical protein